MVSWFGYDLKRTQIKVEWRFPFLARWPKYLIFICKWYSFPLAWTTSQPKWNQKAYKLQPYPCPYLFLTNFKLQSSSFNLEGTKTANSYIINIIPPLLFCLWFAWGINKHTCHRLVFSCLIWLRSMHHHII